MTDTAVPALLDTAPVDAYSLLTRPTLDLTDTEVDIIIADLRARRAKHLASGKPDKQPVLSKPKAESLSTAAKLEAKKANTADLLGSIEWKL